MRKTSTSASSSANALGRAAAGWATFSRTFAGPPAVAAAVAQNAAAAMPLSEVTIPFATAISGGEIQLTLHRQSGETETIVVKIPPGIEDGKKMRLRGKGEPASGRGTAGDLMLTVHVAPHPFFSRRGNDLLVRLPITLGEAVAGASVDVPTPSGTVFAPHSAGNFQRQEVADQRAWRGAEERRQGRPVGRGADRAAHQFD